VIFKEAQACTAAMDDASSYPRQVPNPDFLPPGWKTQEFMYKSGSCLGKTYIRFASIDGRFRNIQSVKAAVKEQAMADGQSVDAAVALLEQKKLEQKAWKEEKLKEQGILKGAEREEAIEVFRTTHCELTGAMVAQFPGWTSHAKRLENCGQVSMTYFDDKGKPWKLIKDIQAALGGRLMRGESMPWIGEAIRQLDGPKKFGSNPARAFVVEGDPLDATAKRLKREALLPVNMRLDKAYHLKPPSEGRSVWTVIPHDIFDDCSLNLDAITPRVEAAGFTCKKRSKDAYTFSGPRLGDVRLCQTGEMLVDSGDQRAILKIAEQYCGTWLLELD